MGVSRKKQKQMALGFLRSVKWPWFNTNGTILGVFGAPPILEPMLVGIGMFTGGRGFDPQPNVFWQQSEA